METDDAATLLQDQLGPLGLTRAQSKTLIALHCHPGGHTIIDLSRLTSLGRSTLSAVIRSLPTDYLRSGPLDRDDPSAAQLGPTALVYDLAQPLEEIIAGLAADRQSRIAALLTRAQDLLKSLPDEGAAS